MNKKIPVFYIYIFFFFFFPADFDRSVYYQFFTIVLIRLQSFALAFKLLYFIQPSLLRMYVEACARR